MAGGGGEGGRAGPPTEDGAGLRAGLEAEARAAGFCAVGVCRPDAIPEAAGRLRAFLAEGRHGQMGWMEAREAWRGDPGALWPEARSVVMLAMSYAPGHDPLDDVGLPGRGAVSVYAQGRDYHDVVKKRLKRVARWLVAAGGGDPHGGRGGPGGVRGVAAAADPGGPMGEPGGAGERDVRAGARDGERVPLSAIAGRSPGAHSERDPRGPSVKVFVDTAPVMEKPLAAAAGLGWQGKHTNLLGRGFGNWVFLGAILTTLDLPVDAPAAERCGSCRRCLDVCPTDAFPAPFQLDARRCVSYLTIEHRGPVDEGLRRGIGNRIYGCDDCLAVCPWNKFAVAAEPMLAPVAGRRAPDLAELAALDDAGFRARFAGSPVKRIGRDRMVRNVAYAMGNSGQARFHAALEPLVRDADPAVADAARWARAELGA